MGGGREDLKDIREGLGCTKEGSQDNIQVCASEATTNDLPTAQYINKIYG